MRRTLRLNLTSLFSSNLNKIFPCNLELFKLTLTVRLSLKLNLSSWVFILL